MDRRQQRSYKDPSAISCLVLAILVVVVPGISQQLSVRSEFRFGDFPLVLNGRAAPIIVHTDDFKVAHIAAADLASDIKEVTGKKPILNMPLAKSVDAVVIIATLGK